MIKNLLSRDNNYKSEEKKQSRTCKIPLESVIKILLCGGNNDKNFT